MVKTRVSGHAKVTRDAVKKAITGIFGKTLTHRSVSVTLDAKGNATAVTNTDVSFLGDLQSGPDLDQRYLDSGTVEVGDAILYFGHDALASVPSPQDFIVDGVNVWEVANLLERFELGGSVVFYAFRCKRHVEPSDVGV